MECIQKWPLSTQPPGTHNSYRDKDDGRVAHGDEATNSYNLCDIIKHKLNIKWSRHKIMFMQSVAQITQGKRHTQKIKKY